MNSLSYVLLKLNKKQIRSNIYQQIKMDYTYFYV